MYTTKSQQVTKCQMVISRKRASKNQPSDLFHYLKGAQSRLNGLKSLAKLFKFRRL